MKNIGILGIGWLGKRIAQQLSSHYNIYATTTTEQKVADLKQYASIEVQEFYDNDLNVKNSWSKLSQLNSIIITVPFSRRMQHSQLKNRYENIAKFLQGYQGQLFLMSSTGIYPQENKLISEETYRTRELHPNLIFIENFMRQKFSQVNILRLGGLMGDNRKLSNYSIHDTSGRVNYVHFEDIIRLLEDMIDQEVNGKTYNVVAPLHPTKKEILDELETTIDTSSPNIEARIIQSDKVQQELGFEFKHKDPRFFA